MEGLGDACASILMGRTACREQLRVELTILCTGVWQPLDMSLELSISALPASREKLVETGDVVPNVRTSPSTLGIWKWSIHVHFYAMVLLEM